MFADLDETIRLLLIRHVPLNLSEVDVSFDAPDREWSGRLSRPTVNCFLYDVRENEDLREAAEMVKGKHVASSVRVLVVPGSQQVRAQAERELAPYRGKMSGAQIDQLLRQYGNKQLLERHGLPRLSLFYL